MGNDISLSDVLWVAAAAAIVLFALALVVGVLIS